MASIWHVGAQAAPNLFPEDWLQDWNILGATQDAAERGLGEAGSAEARAPPGPGRPPPLHHVPRSICGCPGQLSRPFLQ